MDSRNRDGGDDVCSVVRSGDAAYEPVTAAEVADRLGCSRREARDRLDERVEEGVLETKSVGGDCRVWWANGRDAASGAERHADGEPGDAGNTRQRELERYRRIVDNLPVGVYRNTPGPEGEFVEMNSELAAIFGADSVEELMDHSVSDLYLDSEERADFSEKLERDGVVEDYELRQETLDGEEIWIAVTAIRTEEDGEVYFDGIVQDVTEEKEHERRRKQYETVAETATDVIVTIDESSTIRYVNPAVEDVFGYEPSELRGQSLTTLMPDDLAPDYREGVRRYLEEGERTVDRDYVEFPGVRKDGSEVTLAISYSEYEHDGERFFAGIMRDVSDRVERERELRKFETLFKESQDVNAVIEPDGTYSYLTPSAEHVLGYRPEELVGENAFDYIHPDDRERIWEEFATVVEDPEYGPTVELRFERADGSWAVLEAHARNLLDDPQINGIVTYTRDVTERKERERELEESRRRYRTVVENFPNGSVAMVDEDRRYVTVGGESMVEPEASADDLEGSYVPENLSPDLAETFLRNYEAALDGETNTVRERLDDTVYRVRFVPVRDDEGEVFAALGMSQDVTQQVEYERELESQREHLAALNDLHGVVREINDALVAQSTREEIERTVCERLADSDTYQFAWIGDVDARTESVEPRAVAGVDDYFERVDVSVDPEEPEGQGPTGRAVRTESVQVTNDALADPAYEPWREVARAYGFRSSAAIPIVYEETLYGVLGVYTERVGAFEKDEREVISQLGETIGHAIAAVDRKQALMSDEVVELELRIEDLSEEVGHPEPVSGRITVEQTVSVGDDAYLQYGTATPEALETVESLSETVSHWEDVTPIGEVSGETRFELKLSEPPVVSVVADTGGYVDEAVIEADTMHVCIHLPTTVDVRRVVDGVRDAYSTAEMVTRQQVTRSNARDRIENRLTRELTDRQRAALEASFHAGFFEWPRESSGEDIADSLGVSSPTFHQHLRKAQQKLLESLLT